MMKSKFTALPAVAKCDHLLLDPEAVKTDCCPRSRAITKWRINQSQCESDDQANV